MIDTGEDTIQESSSTRCATRPSRSEFEFELTTSFAPAGDQPQAIIELVNGFNAGMTHQTLLGVTGSGKTFTMAKRDSELAASNDCDGSQ